MLQEEEGEEEEEKQQEQQRRDAGTEHSHARMEFTWRRRVCASKTPCRVHFALFK
jgi:hypothetical protein